MSEGWIKLHRQIENHWIFKDPERLKAWITILINANHADKKVVLGNDILICKRGQSVLSLQSWADKFGKNWNKSKVRRFFDLLKSDSMIELENVQKSTRLTVCNYDNYQDERNTSETQVKRERNASETQTTPNKNEKNEKNQKKLKPEKVFSDDLREFTDSLLSYFPDSITSKATEKQKNSFYDTIDKLQRLDGETKESIRYVVQWARSNDFWKSNFFSINKLRQKTNDGVPHMLFFKEKIKSEKAIRENKNYYSGSSGQYLSQRERDKAEDEDKRRQLVELMEKRADQANKEMGR